MPVLVHEEVFGAVDADEGVDDVAGAALAGAGGGICCGGVGMPGRRPRQGSLVIVHLRVTYILKAGVSWQTLTPRRTVH